jgi:outer membrane receptor protein involved in Fe transport
VQIFIQLIGIARRLIDNLLPLARVGGGCEKAWLSGILWMSVVSGQGVEVEVEAELAELVVEAQGVGGGVGGVEGERWREVIGEEGLRGEGTLASYLGRLGWLGMDGYSGNGVNGEARLRGFGEGSGQRVAVLLEGVGLNPSDMSGVDWRGVNLDEIGEVEVLRGGRTVEYGSTAMSGVIRIGLRRPASGWRTVGGVRFGSDGYRQGRVLVERGGAAGWGRVSWHGIEGDGYREHGGYHSRGLGLSGGMEGEVALQARLSWTDSWQQLPGPLTAQAYAEDPRQSLNAGEQFSEREGYGSQLKVRGEKWQVTTGWRQTDRKSDLDGRYSDNGNRDWTVRPELRWGGERLGLRLGLDGKREALDFTSWVDGEREVARADAELERLSGGVFALLEGEGADWFGWRGGIRLEEARTDYDYREYKANQLLPEIRTQRGTFPNPDYKRPADVDPAKSFAGDMRARGWAASMAVEARLGAGLAVWAGADRLYRYPTTDEAGAYQGYELAKPINEELEPETGYQLQLGADVRGEGWWLMLTGYGMLLEDEIVFDDQLRLNVNTDDTLRLGVEADFGLRAGDVWLRGYIHMVDARFVAGPWEDKRVPLVAPVMAGASVEWHAAANVRVETGLRWQDQRVQGNDFANAPALARIPSYHTVYLSLGWSIGAAWYLDVSVENALDSDYLATVVSGGYYPGSGRQIFIGLEAEF